MLDYLLVAAEIPEITDSNQVSLQVIYDRQQAIYDELREIHMLVDKFNGLIEQFRPLLDRYATPAGAYMAARQARRRNGETDRL